MSPRLDAVKLCLPSPPVNGETVPFLLPPFFLFGYPPKRMACRVFFPLHYLLFSTFFSEEPLLGVTAHLGLFPFLLYAFSPFAQIVYPFFVLLSLSDFLALLSPLVNSVNPNTVRLRALSTSGGARLFRPPQTLVPYFCA